MHAESLEMLYLSYNYDITGRGFKALSPLLQKKSSSLRRLNLEGIEITENVARILSKALADNTTLTALEMTFQRIKSKGWVAFKKLLCNTSTIETTFLSNHTIQSFGSQGKSRLPPVIRNLLNLNQSLPKGQIATSKILIHHAVLMKPFFEYEFKVLPILIGHYARIDAMSDKICYYSATKPLSHMRI